MTKAHKRQLADPKGRDGSIDIPGYPRLDLRFNQVLHKTPKHGNIHGVPLNEKGASDKTEANAITMRDSIINSAKNENTKWYLNGQYQAGTPNGCDSINIFDPTNNIVTVFQKMPDGTNKFLTIFKMTPIEKNHFEATNGNLFTDRLSIINIEEY